MRSVDNSGHAGRLPTGEATIALPAASVSRPSNGRSEGRSSGGGEAESCWPMRAGRSMTSPARSSNSTARPDGRSPGRNPRPRPSCISPPARSPASTSCPTSTSGSPSATAPRSWPRWGGSRLPSGRWAARPRARPWSPATPDPGRGGEVDTRRSGRRVAVACDPAARNGPPWADRLPPQWSQGGTSSFSQQGFCRRTTFSGTGTVVAFHRHTAYSCPLDSRGP